MTALVLDLSAAIAALVGWSIDVALSDRLRKASDIHAPHLIDVEVQNGLRRLVIHGELTIDRASVAREDFFDLAIIRYPHVALSDRIWSLRENLTAYDATFVALAEALKLPLITCDAKILNAPGVRAAIEVFPKSQRKRTSRKRRFEVLSVSPASR